MLHRNVAVAGLLALLLLAAHPAVARHCTTYSTSTTSASQVVTPAEGSYLVVDTCVGCVSAFVYEESNGISGLQRADARVDNTCHGLILPDARL